MPNTDQSPIPALDTLDDGPWAHIAQYLSGNDIQALKNTCKRLNKKLDQLDVLWQPFLNRLHSIDETISVTPDGKTIKETFIAGLEKVRTRQLEEIDYLRENHTYSNFAGNPSINAIKPEQPLKLSDVIAIDAELDAINISLITPFIEQAKSTNFPMLDISNKGITRFPDALIDNPAHATFWQTLGVLDCSSNLLKALPKNIGNLESLGAMSCNNNILTAIPDSIGKLQALRMLHVYDNKLTSLPASIVELANLLRLHVSNNQIKILPKSIGDLEGLQMLILNRNHLSELPASIGNLRALQGLECSNNHLAAIPESIVNLQALKGLGCSNNHITKLPESIINLQALEGLDFSGNPITALPEFIGKLVALKNLYCSNLQLTTLPESICNLVALESLKLDNNQLTTLPDSIGNLQALQGLDFSNNLLTTLPEFIGNLQTLGVLTFENNQITALPASIGNLRMLGALRCQNNQIRSIQALVANLQTLQTLDCKNNQITTLPTAFSIKYGESWTKETMDSQRRPVNNQPVNPPAVPAPIVVDNARTLLNKRKMENDRSAKRQRISAREVNSLTLDERWLPISAKRNSEGKQSLPKRRG